MSELPAHQWQKDLRQKNGASIFLPENLCAMIPRASLYVRVRLAACSSIRPRTVAVNIARRQNEPIALAL
jgi:hypothetical protein